MIQLSEFFQYSFVLILKRKCLVGASRIRSGESGTPSTIIYTRWSSRRYELGCDAPVHYNTPIHNPRKLSNVENNEYYLAITKNTDVYIDGLDYV